MALGSGSAFIPSPRPTDCMSLPCCAVLGETARRCSRVLGGQTWGHGGTLNRVCWEPRGRAPKPKSLILQVGCLTLSTRDILGLSDSIVGAVPHTAGCLAASLASMPLAPPLQCDNQKGLQTVPKGLWGKIPLAENHCLKANWLA